jgi:hypothetical protein
MITCPVCEHQQPAGSECEVCGRRLAEGLGTDPQVVPLEGLELTSLAPGAETATDQPSLLAELEGTRFEAAELPLLEEVMPDLEQTRAEPVEVSEDLTPDVERLQAGLPQDLPTPLPTATVCRYCRVEAAPGERFCASCGRQLAWHAGSAAGRAGDQPGGLRLCSCGTPVTSSRCPACGARNAAP